MTGSARQRKTTELNVHKLVLPDCPEGQRLDLALAAALPQFSRSRLATWVTVRCRHGRRRDGTATRCGIRGRGRGGARPGAAQHRSAGRVHRAEDRAARSAFLRHRQAGRAGGSSRRGQSGAHAAERTAGTGPETGRHSPGRHCASHRQGHQRPAGGGANPRGAQGADRCLARARGAARVRGAVRGRTDRWRHR